MSGFLDLLNRCGEWFVPVAYRMLLQSSVLIMIIAALDFLLRKRARALVRYSFWMLVLIKLVLPVNLSSPASVVTITPKFEYSPPVISFEPPFETSASEVNAEHALDRMDASENPVIVPVPSKPEVARRKATPHLFGLVFLAWMIIGAALVGIVLWRAARLHVFVRSCDAASGELEAVLDWCSRALGLRRRVELRVSGQNVTPSLCGVLRPCIVLPRPLVERLSSNEMKAVLLHELIHFKRKDVLVNLAQTVLQIAYFFHPLLWAANARIRKLREEAVDECVLVAMGREAETYPETLISVAKLAVESRPLSFGGVGIMESKSAFAARVRRILTRPFPSSAKLGGAGLVTILILAFCILPMAGRGKEKTDAVPENQEQDSTDFLASLKIFPDPNFPEFQSTTNRLYESADKFLPLILKQMRQPIADADNRELRQERGKLIWALQFMGDKAAPAIPALIKELENDDPAAQRGPHYSDYPPAFWAATALGAIGPAASNAVPVLIDAAHFGNYKAFPALARIAPESSEVAALVIHGYRDLSKGNGGNANFSRLAALSGISILAPRSEKAREVLFEAITDGDPFVQQSAVRLIRKENISGGEAALKRALENEETSVQTAAALAEAGDHSNEVRESLVKGLKDPATQLLALRALQPLVTEGGDWLNDVLRLVNISDKSVRTAALELLPQFPAAASDGLIAAVSPLLDDYDPQMRRLAVLALGSTDVMRPETIAALRKALADPKKDVKTAALQAVERLKVSELAPDVLKLAEDPDEEVQTSAWMTATLFPREGKALVPTLIKALESGGGWAAAIGLGNIGAEAAPAVPSLSKALQQSNAVLNNAIFALGKIGPAARPSIPEIEKLLTNREPMIRLNAALALWRIDRRKEIVQVLKSWLESEKNWDRLAFVNAASTRIYLLNLAKELGPDAQELLPLVRQLTQPPKPAIRTPEKAAAKIERKSAENSPFKSKSNEELLAEYQPYAEMRIRSQAAIVGELIGRPDAVTFLASKLRKDPTRPETANALQNRLKATWLLTKKRPAALPALPLLLDCFEDDEEVRRGAADCLAAIGPRAKEAISTLIEELQFQNRRAANALAKIAPASTEVQDAIVTVLMDDTKTADFRWQSLEAVHQMTVRSPKLAAALARLAEEGEGELKNAALRLKGVSKEGVTFGRTPWANYTEKDIPSLISKLRADPKDHIALMGLSEVATNSDEALDLYIELLEGRKARFSGNVIVAIMKQGARAAKAVPVLVKATADEDTVIANNSVHALGRIGPAAIDAKPRLIELLEDPDSNIRQNAANSLHLVDPNFDSSGSIRFEQKPK